tara:strand:- start:168 stop:362 length:195 start_codon:yes stop_codon:yes gene_type:complete
VVARFLFVAALKDASTGWRVVKVFVLLDGPVHGAGPRFAKRVDVQIDPQSIMKAIKFFLAVKQL